jgi:uncharacterized phage protein (TIGR02220 family)
MANIIKGRFDQPFVTLYNEAVQDPELSAQAKGVHAYLLSLPGDWTIRAKELHNHFKNGRDAIISALNELVAQTYVEKKENRDGGRFDGVTYICYPVKYQRAVEMGLIHPDGEETPKPKDPKKVDKPKEPKEDIPFDEIIEYLNNKAEKKFKSSSKANKEKIRARWNEGWRTDDFKKVIDNKVIQWAKDPKMAEYLRPETLFGTKFESYLNATPTKPKGSGPSFPTKPAQPQKKPGRVMTEEERIAKLKEIGAL